MDEVFGQIEFAFPSVKVGSIVEYQYRSVMQSYWGLRDWYFQKGIPVLVSRYHLKTIFNKKFSYKIFKREDVPVTVVPENDRIFFEMLNIPALTDEPYMDAKKDYLQRVTFLVGNYSSRWGSSQVSAYKSSWRSLNIDLLSSRFFGWQIGSTIKGASNFIDSVKLLKSPEEKMKTIYNYVKKNFKWNEKNDFLSEDVNKVWENRKGSSGDINMVLMNLLNAVKLEAYPLLVSKRSHGKVDSSYANSDQFNSLQVCVNINGRKYILDATEEDYPCNMIPESVLNTMAFMVDRISGELLTLIVDSVMHREVINIEMELTDRDTLRGHVNINNAEYAKFEKAKSYKIDPIKFKERYELQQNIVFNIPKLDVYDAGTDSMLLLEKMDFNTALNNSGEYKFVPLNLFSTLNKNPFIADDRFSTINFGYNKLIVIKGKIKFPNSYSLDALPENITLYDPQLDIRFSRDIKFIQEANTVEFKMEVTILKSLYEVAEYPALKKIYKTIFGKLAEQVVLKRKL